MNIFVLDNNPKLAAQYHCDQHLNKMIVESCQLLMTPYWLQMGLSSKKLIESNKDLWYFKFHSFPRKDEIGNSIPYGIGFKHHPCTKWVLESKENWLWLLSLAEELIIEKLHRSNKGHSCEAIVNWFKHNQITNLPEIYHTEFIQAIPSYNKVSNKPVVGYRNAYHCNIYYKGWFPTWTNRETPHWYKQINHEIFDHYQAYKFPSRLTEDQLNVLSELLKTSTDPKEINKYFKTYNRLNKKLKVTNNFTFQY